MTSSTQRRITLGSLGRAASVIPDLGGLVQVGLLMVPIGAAVISAFAVGGVVAWRWVALVGFVVGIAVGVLVVHPAMATLMMRRQSEIEVRATTIKAQFAASTGRVPQGWTQTRTIRALIDGVETWDLVFNYGNTTGLAVIDPKRGVRSVGPLVPTVHGYYRCTLRLEKSLQRGEELDIEYELKMPSAAGECPPVMGITPVHPTRKVELSVQFDPGDLPMHFREDFALAPIATTQQIVRYIRPDSSNTVTVKYRRLKPGHKYGFAWDWT